MANYKKNGRNACANLCRHYERAKDEFGSYVRFSNINIDSGRTHLNYNLAPIRNISQLEYIKERLSNVKCLKRDDVKVFCSWVVTVPKDLPKNEYDSFFKETYKFLEEKYGQKNVVSSYVHMDEVTPHMHFAFIPVVLDKKKGIEKVSSKECVTRVDLQKFHSELQNHLEFKLGHEVSILNEATKEGNKAIDELKRGTAIETLNNTYKEIEFIEGHIIKLEEEKNALETKIDTLQGRILSLEEINQIEIKKPLFGKEKAIVQLSYEDAINLKMTASKVNEINKLLEESNYKLKKIERLKSDADELFDKAKRIPMEQQIESVKLQKENRELKKQLDLLLKNYPEVFSEIQNIQKSSVRIKTNHLSR